MGGNGLSTERAREQVYPAIRKFSNPGTPEKVVNPDLVARTRHSIVANPGPAPLRRSTSCIHAAACNRWLQQGESCLRARALWGITCDLRVEEHCFALAPQG